MYYRGQQLRSRAEGKKKMDAEIARVEVRKKLAEEKPMIVDKMPVTIGGLNHRVPVDGW
jgi:hypothetical protein